MRGLKCISRFLNSEFSITLLAFLPFCQIENAPWPAASPETLSKRGVGWCNGWFSQVLLIALGAANVNNNKEPASFSVTESVTVSLNTIAAAAELSSIQSYSANIPGGEKPITCVQAAAFAVALIAASGLLANSEVKKVKSR
ncbi:MAG: hypothetical protein ACI8PW_002062 [Methylophilaceae bacterium]|jgi:hypothetical protein